MKYANRRYSKSYRLGCKPTTVLKKQLERTLVKDIELMQTEIKKLEAKRILYIDYKGRRIQYEQQFKKCIEPIIEKKRNLLGDPLNYKSGFIYLFRKKEIKQEVVLIINELDEQILAGKNELEIRYDILNNPLKSTLFKAEEVDGKIESEINEGINFYKNAINTYQCELELKQEKNQQLENIKGLAAQAVNKTRQRANQIKSNMIINEYCPYCGKVIDEVHVDHIYPVAKGGLSVTKNMVRVCSACNRKKKDLTLNQFIKKYSLDREFIENNLDELNKSY